MLQELRLFIHFKLRMSFFQSKRRRNHSFVQVLCVKTHASSFFQDSFNLLVNEINYNHF